MATMNRREMMRATTLGLGVGAWATSRGMAERSRPTERPNLIFILADDLGYGDLGCYGQEVIETPNLDRMAREGMRFTQCYAGSTVCAPSRCCLMTGRHTGHAYIRGNKRVPLPDGEVTVAEGLREAGYATAIVGKWGLGNEDTSGAPNRQGFDYWFGYLDQGHAHNYYPDHLWRNETKVALDGNVQHAQFQGVAQERRQYSHDLFTAEALDYLDRPHGQQPFFLYLAYTVPHANNERGRHLGDGMEVPDYGPYADRDWPDPEKGRAAMIARLDRDIGRLFDRLRALGLDGNTLVFFSSDNGPHSEGGSDAAFFHSAGPCRGIKRDLYEGGIRIPMIAWWPGHVPAGSVSDYAWAFWDFMPTALDIAGARPQDGLDGISVLPTLLGREQAPHEFLYWEFHERGFAQAVRRGQWKGLRLDPSKPIELYDLGTDTGETRNLAEAHSEIAARMAEYLETARVPSEHWPIAP
ncbi:MAG TPA: arylsulfatase [Candidatus Hydrogenedentes bacterium]|nr:arylsulfatase [Candidatus Hydrogenedentota bacterium]HPG67287.1 arylsulfatase [Candidatus Hydrogenedentota bacterium]